MNVTVIGTGYVGLVAGACFAETGHDVVCVDRDPAKIAMLGAGILPIYEPGLDELVSRNAAAGRLTFTGDLPAAIAHGEIIFVAVGTPTSADGSADLTQVLDAAREIAASLTRPAVVVLKSTVPVGTADQVDALLRTHATVRTVVVSNPEFLKQGNAVEDFLHPDRVVVGLDAPEARGLMESLYAPFMRTRDRLLLMDRRSAELAKYASNAMLATRITLMNEVANLCEIVGADVDAVRRAVGSDRRIGPTFLFPGPGYGGSCFPKDVRALAEEGRRAGERQTLLEAVDRANQRQRGRLLDKVRAALGGVLADRHIAIWGLAFKAKTDDVRESPALDLITGLLEAGATVAAHDPAAIATARNVLADRITYAPNGYAALRGADALVVATDWNEYRHPDLARMSAMMRRRVIVDGRNLYDPERLAHMQFDWHGVGRMPRLAARDGAAA